MIAKTNQYITAVYIIKVCKPLYYTKTLKSQSNWAVSRLNQVQGGVAGVVLLPQSLHDLLMTTMGCSLSNCSIVVLHVLGIAIDPVFGRCSIFVEPWL